VRSFKVSRFVSRTGHLSQLVYAGVRSASRSFFRREGGRPAFAEATARLADQSTTLGRGD
jgi:hypothetical protein